MPDNLDSIFKEFPMTFKTKTFFAFGLFLEQISLIRLMRQVTFTALSFGKGVMQTEPAIIFGNTGMTRQAEIFLFFLKQFLLCGFMGQMTGQTFTGGRWWVLDKTLNELTLIMAFET